jgi:hypothetical protein
VYRIDGEIIEIVQCGTHYHKWKKFLKESLIFSIIQTIGELYVLQRKKSHW